MSAPRNAYLAALSLCLAVTAAAPAAEETLRLATTTSRQSIYVLQARRSQRQEGGIPTAAAAPSVTRR